MTKERLGRRCGVAAGSWSCWDGAFGAPFRDWCAIWKLSQLHREFEPLRAMEMTTMSIDVNRQFDFDLREMTQGHQGEGPRRSANYRKDTQVLLRRPTLREWITNEGTSFSPTHIQQVDEQCDA